MNRIRFAVVLLLLLLGTLVTNQGVRSVVCPCDVTPPDPPDPPAAVEFGGLRPAVQGFGTGATAAPVVYGELNRAGRGGAVYRVTTLADNRTPPVRQADGTYRSSLRAAVEASGPRVVVFETSGVICLDRATFGPLAATHPYLTIAGQTAPSPGISIRCAPTRLETHDVLVQHVRFRFDRLGSLGSGIDTIPLLVGGASQWTYNVLLDHVSVAFANGYMSIGSNDPAGIMPNAWDFAVTDSLIAYPLVTDPAIYAGYGMAFWTVDNGQITAARNVFVHSSHRNLSAANMRLQYINNLIYGSGPGNDWTVNAIQASSPQIWPEGGPCCRTEAVIIGNRFIPSTGTGSGGTAGTNPDHKSFNWQFSSANIKQRGDRLYVVGNTGPFITGPTIDGQAAGVHWELETFPARDVMLEQPFDWHTKQAFRVIDTEALPPALAASVGARPLDRDAVDARAIAELQAGVAGDRANMGARIVLPGDLGVPLTLAVNTRAFALPANPNAIVDSAGRTALERVLENQARALEGLPAIPETRTATPSYGVLVLGLLLLLLAIALLVEWWPWRPTAAQP